MAGESQAVVAQCSCRGQNEARIVRWAEWRQEFYAIVWDKWLRKPVVQCTHMHGRRIGEDGEALARRCAEKLLRNYLRNCPRCNGQGVIP